MKNKPYPFYPFLFAAFPVLALIAYNKFETQFSSVFRPLIVVLLFAALVYGIFFLIFRKNWRKAALISSVTLLIIFSYGHIFSLIESSESLNGLIGQHRYVVGIFLVVWVVCLILTIKVDIKSDFTKLMNYVGIILVAMPLLQTGWFYVSEAIARSRSDLRDTEEQSTDILSYTPDVYYIILDMYARPDALLEDYEADVSDFIDSMTEMGFYYASESHSNYGETYNSISTTLNMQLLGEYTAEQGIKLGGAEYRDLIIHSEARSIFESMNYQIIAFSTGYRWSELADADIYYQIKSIDPFHDLTPFELILVKNLIVYPFRGYAYELIPGLKPNPEETETENIYLGMVQSLHIETQRNVLEKLPEIAENSNATFTFAHVLIPHPPFVFDTDGSILDDPGYYSGDKASAINEFYEIDGYIRQVQFISLEIKRIVGEILAESENEPIIIIQGDHGKEGDNRNKVLNLYYFPNQDFDSLYPSITPVNSFRVVFNTFFGKDYPLKADTVIPLDEMPSDE